MDLIINIISNPIHSLFIIFFNLTKDLGITIILFTFLLKIILFPLDFLLFKEEKKLQKIRKRIDEETKGIKDFLERGKIMTKIYQEEKLNPFTNIFLQFITIIIFLAVFLVIKNILNTLNPSFLGIIDLSKPNFYLGLILLITQIIFAFTQPKEARKIAIFLSGFIGILFFIFPSGFLVYWLINTLLTILERKIFLRDEIKPTVISIDKK
ncbi:MAG: YidC/Oxa1 family membrane protein insertase [Minisyncoccia bacterium]